MFRLRVTHYALPLYVIEVAGAGAMAYLDELDDSTERPAVPPADGGGNL
jgi:hypothetical protein